MRRYLAAGIWLVLTVTATLIVWAAVSVVASDVTDRPAPVVAHRDVVVALAGGSGASSAAGAAGASAAGSTTTATTAVRPVPSSTTPVATTVPTTVPGRGRPTTSVVAPVTTTVVPTTTPTTKPPGHSGPPPTTLPAPVGGSAAYSTEGGTVAVACTAFNTIRLVAALPNDGYQAVVFSGGPLFVQVNFIGEGNNFPVSAVCIFGQPFQGNKKPPGS